jgi:hypothetical protein
MALKRQAAAGDGDQRPEPTRASETPRQAAKVESASEKTTRESKRKAATPAAAETISRCHGQCAPSGVNLTST